MIFPGSDLHLTPAYGRDYRNKATVQEAWHAGADFLLHGKYVSQRDVKPGTQVWIRYARLTKMVRVQ